MKSADVFELKRTARDIALQIVSICDKIGKERREKEFVWKCPWCHKENIRQNAGADRCFVCGATVFTEFTGYENEIRVKHSHPPRREHEHLDAIGPELGAGAPSRRGKISTTTQG